MIDDHEDLSQQTGVIDSNNMNQKNTNLARKSSKDEVRHDSNSNEKTNGTMESVPYHHTKTQLNLNQNEQPNECNKSSDSQNIPISDKKNMTKTENHTGKNPIDGAQNLSMACQKTVVPSK